MPPTASFPQKRKPAPTLLPRRLHIPAVLWVTGLLVLGGAGCSNSSQSKSIRSVVNTEERHVVVISVDGLRAGFLLKELQQGRLPNIARLRSEGSYAEGVTGTYPALTAPAHTTIVTGKLPAEHGIYTSKCFSGDPAEARDWTAKDIRVPALWDRVQEAHLTSAAISWPLAIGAPITWDTSGILNANRGVEVTLKRLAKWAAPGIIDEALRGFAEVGRGASLDAVRAHLAIGLIKEYKPNLLLLRFPDLDDIQHRHGYASPKAVEALERVDGYIGDMHAAIDESGLRNTTDVFLLSDHGFESFTMEIQPNLLLAKAGLLNVDDQGKIVGGEVCTVENDGSLFIYWPDSENLKGRVKEALRPLREQGLIQSVLDRDALAKLGADPRVQLALEAPPGAVFEEEATGPLVRRLTQPRGAHGYLPSLPEMQAVFIASGPGIKNGVDLHQIHMTAIASTILKALGIDTPQFGGHLAIFDPGCCSGNSPVWSGTDINHPGLQTTQAGSSP